jgi:hypothetical protein
MPGTSTRYCRRISTRARAEVFGGSLHLDARLGVGTRVELRVSSTGGSPQ